MVVFVKLSKMRVHIDDYFDYNWHIGKFSIKVSESYINPGLAYSITSDIRSKVTQLLIT